MEHEILLLFKKKIYWYFHYCNFGKTSNYLYPKVSTTTEIGSK